MHAQFDKRQSLASDGVQAIFSRSRGMPDVDHVDSEQERIPCRAPDRSVPTDVSSHHSDNTVESHRQVPSGLKRGDMWSRDMCSFLGCKRCARLKMRHHNRLKRQVPSERGDDTSRGAIFFDLVRRHARFLLRAASSHPACLAHILSAACL